MKTNYNHLSNLLISMLFVTLLSAVFNSCTDQKLNLKSGNTNEGVGASSIQNESALNSSAFLNTVGAPINRETGLRWINNFASKSSRATAEYFIQASALKAILSNSSCTGISLYYATDHKGQIHIIPIGTDIKGRVVVTSSLAINGGVIDWNEAWQWINNYSGAVRSHFFGSITFTRLLADQQAGVVRASFALDDANSPQLLLSNAGDPTPPGYEDESRPCPPLCPL